MALTKDASSGISFRCFSLSASLFLFLLVCLSSTSAFAEGLMDIYLQAKQNDPTLQIANFDKLAIMEGRNQALSELLPTFSASAEYRETSQDVKSSDNDVFDKGDTNFHATSYGLTLTQPIFRWDSIVGYRQSKVENLRAEVEYILAEQELIVRVADLYLQALSAKDLLDYAMAEQVAIGRHYELASERFDMGLTPITDLHDARARLATTQAKTIEAENMFDDALQALRELTNTSITSIKPLQSDISLTEPLPVQLDLWIEQATNQNISIKMKKHAVEVAEYEINRQRSAHLPTVDAVGRYHYEDTEGTVFGGGSEVATAELLLQLNVPLYQGGYVNSRVRESRHRLDSARKDLLRERRAVKRQTRSAYLGVNSDLSRIDAFQQSVISNQLALEAKQEGYLSGLYTSLNVLDAERDLSLVKLDYAQARYDYLLNSLKLKQAVGTLTSQDLTVLDRWFNE